ncbi:MAG: hypothetical protein ACMG6H_16365 [Acidobacteriota bacterium]
MSPPPEKAKLQSITEVLDAVILSIVVPAKAGIQWRFGENPWVPAFAETPIVLW